MELKGLPCVVIDLAGNFNAQVPVFIAKNKPGHQMLLRGGLRWLDKQCLTRFGQPFAAYAAPQ